jgi:hypothetical protein
MPEGQFIRPTLCAVRISRYCQVSCNQIRARSSHAKSIQRAGYSTLWTRSKHRTNFIWPYREPPSIRRNIQTVRHNLFARFSSKSTNTHVIIEQKILRRESRLYRLGIGS